METYEYRWPPWTDAEIAERERYKRMREELLWTIKIQDDTPHLDKKQVIKICHDFPRGEYTRQVIRLTETKAVKFGGSTGEAEARAQRRARQIVDLSVVYVPIVHEFFTDDNGGGYIVMEYINGRLLNPSQPQEIEKMAQIIQHLWTRTSNEAGPLGGEMATAILFSEDIPPYFDSAESIESWVNKRIIPPEPKISLKDQPFVLCHLDLVPRNILVSSSGVYTVIDWCSAGFYPRVFEICAQAITVREDVKYSEALLNILPALDANDTQMKDSILQAYYNSIRYSFRPKEPPTAQPSSFKPIVYEPPLFCTFHGKWELECPLASAK